MRSTTPRRLAQCRSVHDGLLPIRVDGLPSVSGPLPSEPGDLGGTGSPPGRWARFAALCIGANGLAAAWSLYTGRSITPEGVAAGGVASALVLYGLDCLSARLSRRKGGEMASIPDFKYTSMWSRMLAWLVFMPPFNWIGNMQTHVAEAQLKQAFGECGAQSISLALIVRGPQQSSLPSAIPSDLGASK